MAAGVAIGDPIENEIINNSNIIYDYQEIPNTNETNQIKDYAVQVNYNLESIPDKVMKQINKITSELEDNQSDNQIHTIEDIINNTETDPESKKLIQSMIEKDEKEHAGRDEATVYLVKQLQTDCENEIKTEEQEPYKYDEKDFPALGSKQQSRGNGMIMINQNQNNLELNQYLKLSAQA